jgi:methylmalonyl-CoA epimerase
MTIKINHIAIVVSDLDAARQFWVEALGLPLERVAHVPEEGVEVAFLPAGEGEIELIQPVDAESGVARYLEKRGPGMHHLCLEVEDLSRDDGAAARGRRRADQRGAAGHGRWAAVCLRPPAQYRRGAGRAVRWTAARVIRRQPPGTTPMDQCHSQRVTFVTKDIGEICYPMDS